jgi:hypothetical protein
MPRAQRKKKFPFNIQLVANWPISMLLSIAGEHLAPVDSTFGFQSN